jgi:hypothetical protein
MVHDNQKFRTLDRRTVESMILSIHNLMETLNLTADQAMEALKIPEEERDNYLKQL